MYHAFDHGSYACVWLPWSWLRLVMNHSWQSLKVNLGIFGSENGAYTMLYPQFVSIFAGKWWLTTRFGGPKNFRHLPLKPPRKDLQLQMSRNPLVFTQQWRIETAEEMFTRIFNEQLHPVENLGSPKWFSIRFSNESYIPSHPIEFGSKLQVFRGHWRRW